MVSIKRVVLVGVTLGLQGVSMAAVDYLSDDNWVCRSSTAAHAIDVFFVHPTTYNKENGKGKGITADLGDAVVNAATDDMVHQMTAAFSDCCNVFAPRYRQMNIRALSMPDADRAECELIAKQDVYAAFVYYLDHLNQGRPFMLAGHSQGSLLMKLILLEHPEQLDRSRLIAAYFPGYSFSAADLKTMNLQLSENPDQTAALITWNTVGPGGTSPTLLDGALCVNPLSWKSDTAPVPASENRGARICLSDDTMLEIPAFTAARITSAGGLEIPEPEASVADQLFMPMGPGCYHFYDYDFFFNNIKENAANRCSVWLKAHPAYEK